MAIEPVWKLGPLETDGHTVITDICPDALLQQGESYCDRACTAGAVEPLNVLDCMMNLIS